MNSAVNALFRHFLRHSGKTRIRPRPAGRAGRVVFPSVLKRNVVASKKEGENRRVRHSYACLISRVCRIRRSDHQRSPVRVRLGVRIAVFVGAANCRHRTPQSVLIFARKSSQQRVVNRDVKQGKKPGIFNCRMPARNGEVAGDIVPCQKNRNRSDKVVVPNSRIKVCSSVRVVLVAEPIALSSFKSAA